MKRQRGFTLVELMVVIAVIAMLLILAASIIAGKGKLDLRRMMAFWMPREAAVLELQRLNDRADSAARSPAKVETVYVDSTGR